MYQELTELGAQALRKAALNEEAKAYVLNNPPLFQTLKKAADRYIGGETLAETIGKAKAENAQGYKCSIEFMGENVATEQEAHQATNEFVRIAQQIAQQSLHATVSLDLSHVGLALSRELGLANLTRILEAARPNNTEVIISAEGVALTDAILDTYLAVAPSYSHVSITLQAYLHRSKDDFQALLQQPGRIRLVKGAFDAPPQRALPRGNALNERYLEYLDQLLSAGHACSIATHHDKIQQQARKLIDYYRASPESYEFESLYGIQPEQLAALKNEGHPAKVYFVYGKEWYLYLCNRLAEYPLNLFRALNDMVN